MIVVRNTFSGGSRIGPIKTYALIKVTYPAGSVCTCTNGRKTFKAKDTSGSVLFRVPEAGTWTVKCTDGSSADMEDVTVSTMYSVLEVSLNYIVTNNIFVEGSGAKVEMTPHTARYHTSAGYAPDVSSSASVNTTRIYIKGNTGVVSETESHDVAGYVDTASIDLTNYNTLKVEATAANSFTVYVRSGSTNKVTKTISATSRTTTNIDISSLTGAHTLRFYANGSTHGGTIHNVWLES